MFEIGAILTVEPKTIFAKKQCRMYGLRWEVLAFDVGVVKARAVDADSDFDIIRTIGTDGYDFKIVSSSALVRHVEP